MRHDIIFSWVKQNRYSIIRLSASFSLLLFLFLSPLVSLPSFAFGGTATASSVAYNPTSHVLSVHLASFSPSDAGGHFGNIGVSSLSDISAGQTGANSCIGTPTGTISDPMDFTGNVDDGCSYVPSGTYYIWFFDNDFGEWYRSQALTYSAPTPTPNAAYVLGDTDRNNLNAAVGSIPTAAKGEVFAIFPIVMPYILLIVTIGIAFFIVKLLMKKKTVNG